jgi:two-component system sporulation sensor kinase A
MHARQLEITGTLKNVHYNLLNKDGESFVVEISASLVNDALGSRKAVICVFRDITERLNSELALKRSEEQFRSVWENSSEGMRLSDSEGKILAVNKAFCRLSGLEEQEIINRYFYELYNDNTASEKERYKRIFSESDLRKSHQAQFNFISGKVLDLHIIYSLITEREQPILLSIFHDITEAKRSEKELRKSEKLAAIGKMAAYLAHEIKTPLASIKINIDMMSKTLNLPKDKQRSFNIIQKEVKRLHNLLKNVLQFSRQVDLVFMEINLHDLIESLKLLFDPVFAQNQIVFINRIPADILIIGDRQKLQTVFSHLIENAVEALPKRGRIEIFSEIIEDQNKAEIFVQDSGPGIINMQQAFDPFFTTKNSGTGLGLSIAQKIIEQHNGAIEIYSSVPGETIFKIELSISRNKNGHYSNNR